MNNLMDDNDTVVFEDGNLDLMQQFCRREIQYG